MSTVSTPTDSPVHVEPLHNPAYAAQVVVPQAPLGNATNGKIINQLPGMGAKALLAKKMAKSSNPKYISPTDNMMTPCSQKITAAKKKRFDKGAKPMQQLSFQNQSPEEVAEPNSSDEENINVAAAQENKSEGTEVPSEVNTVDVKMDDDENPF